MVKRKNSGIKREFEAASTDDGMAIFYLYFKFYQVLIFPIM